MSDYFRNFPKVEYTFGDNRLTNKFVNLAVYVDVLDQVKDQASFFDKYIVMENERPDQVSFKLYNSTNYHWTFFLLNDHLRESGWPVSNMEIRELAKKYFPHRIITTKTSIASIMNIGTIVQGTSSGSTGTVVKRNLDLGQIVVDADGAFSNGEVIFNTENVTETAVVHSNNFQYLSVHHYEDADGNYVDIDPALQTTGILRGISYLDRLVTKNDELRELKILKPASLQGVVAEYNRLLGV